MVFFRKHRVSVKFLGHFLRSSGVTSMNVAGQWRSEMGVFFANALIRDGIDPVRIIVLVQTDGMHTYIPNSDYLTDVPGFRTEIFIIFSSKQ